MSSTPDPGSGDRPPTARLDRPPGERYRTAAARGGTDDAGGRRPSVARATILGGVVAAAGGLLLAGLGILDLGAGLLAVGAAIGWAIGIAVRHGATTEAGAAMGRTGRSALAGGLALAAMLLGFGLVWLWARSQGGTLGPLDYLGERFGPLPYVLVGFAVAVAAVRAR